MPSKESNGFNAKCKTCPSTLSLSNFEQQCAVKHLASGLSSQKHPNTFLIVTMVNYVLTNNALSGFISRSLV